MTDILCLFAAHEDSNVSGTSRDHDNPFAEEDARTDPVFKEHCIASVYHPSWDKVYGDPANPDGDHLWRKRGGQDGAPAADRPASKRIQPQPPTGKLYTIEYDDFNPFLDRFRDKLSRVGKRQRTACWPNGNCGTTWTRS